MSDMKTVVIPVVVGALGTIKKGMVENIKKVSERAAVTEIQKICMLGSTRILRKVLSVWTEWLTWVTGAPGAWFAPGWCTKRTPAKAVIEGTITVMIPTDSEIKILQKKAKQSVAPSEEFNNLRSAPEDMGNQEACDMNVVKIVLTKIKRWTQMPLLKRSNAKKSLI